MPICPGCSESVSYGRLRAHQEYCRGIWGDERGDKPVAVLAERAIELERRLAKVSSGEDLKELERRVGALEKHLGQLRRRKTRE